MKLAILVALIAICLSTENARCEEPVYFGDPKLRACVEDALAVLDPTPTDMLQLTRLTCTHTVNDGVKDLVGLEYATNLERLTLSYNEIRSLSPLSDLVNLSRLTINDNRIGSLSALSNLTNLTYIDAHRNQIASVSGLSDLNNLEYLSLRLNGLSSISGLSDLASLDTLNLQNNELSQISALSTLSQLADLDLQNNRISSLSALSDLDNLSDLDVRDNDITTVSPLTSLQSLASVNLSGNYFLDDEAYSRDLQTLLDNNPGLSLSYEPRPYPSLQVAASDGTHSGRVRVTWLEIDNGPVYTSFYRVYRAASESDPRKAVSPWQESSTYDDVTAQPEVVYTYWVAVAVSQNGASATTDDRSDTGWASGSILHLDSTAGGRVTTSIEESNIRLGDVVDLVAEPIDETLFAFRTWTGSALDRGLIPDPTHPQIRLSVDDAYSLRAHFLTKMTTLFVDDDAPEDVKANDPSVSDPRENGTSEHPFDEIQEAIDVAGHDVTIVVRKGTYEENLRPWGQSVLLTGIDYPVLQGRETAPLVSFVSGEDANCVLNGFVLTMGRDDLAGAVYCQDSHPTVSNCLIVGNRATPSGTHSSAIYGINSRMTIANCTIADNLMGDLGGAMTLVDSDAVVINSIFWNNGPTDLRLEGDSRPSISYSNIRHAGSATTGMGNITLDPGFAAPGRWVTTFSAGTSWTPGDYHLMSLAGRWDPAAEAWLPDEDTSLCVDAGDPTWPVADEPVPHGQRTNMGAYGGTGQASKSTLDVLAVVVFADPLLKQAIEDRLATIDPTIIDMRDLIELESINTVNDGIIDLTGLEHAVHLQALNLAYNQIDDVSPLAGLNQLSELIINDNRIQDITPLSGLINLQYVDLHRNRIEDISALAGLTNLKTLFLRWNQIRDLSPLAGLVNLKALNLKRNEIEDIGPLITLVDLEVLNLATNSIADISVLSNLPKLTHLDLSQNRFSDVGVLARLPALQRVDLTGVFTLDQLAYHHYLPTIQAFNPSITLLYEPDPSP